MVQRRTTSNEFLDWVEWMDREEWDEHHREDYYMAQLTAEVARGHTKGGKVRVENYLLKFRTVEDRKPITQTELGARVAVSKAKWAGVVAQKGTDKRRQGPPGGPKPPRPGK